LKPTDVDVAHLYDGFSVFVLLWLEALGFCPPGGGGPFVDGGWATDLGGALPTNTCGGQLSFGRLHGFGLFLEGVRQLRGEGADRQVPDAEVACVGVGGGVLAGAFLLTR
jgi:acetyl-CoA acetyltransferase